MLEPFFYINFTSFAVCFLFMLFLIIVYVSKKNINNSENIIYKNILFWTAISLILSIGANVIIIINHMEFSSFFNRLFYGCVICWLYFLLLYLTFITNEHRKDLYSFLNKNIKMVLIISYIILSIIYSVFLFMDYDSYVLENGILVEISGFLLYFYYVILISLTLIGIISVIINHKYTSKKKLLPFYIITPVGLAAIVLGIILPRYAFIQTFFTLISYLMYHTIENPDVKMLNELELAKNAAEQASNAKSDFLSSMSHELRTPLNAIVGLSQAIEQESDKTIVKEDAHDIFNASNNLLEMVDSILDINKIESSSMEIVNSIYNPLQVFEDLIKNIKIRLGDKPIQLRSRFSNELPTNLYGDKSKLKIIINNLLTNAVKYTSDGYIDFDVDCMVKDDVCNLRITISDTGRGISEEQLDKLFTKFYRLDSDKDSDIEGAGLGLALTKSLVELMDGKITVNSSDGMGSTFFVSLSQKIVRNNDNEIL